MWQQGSHPPHCYDAPPPPDPNLYPNQHSSFIPASALPSYYTNNYYPQFDPHSTQFPNPYCDYPTYAEFAPLPQVLTLSLHTYTPTCPIYSPSYFQAPYCLPTYDRSQCFDYGCQGQDWCAYGNSFGDGVPEEMHLEDRGNFVPPDEGSSTLGIVDEFGRIGANVTTTPLPKQDDKSGTSQKILKGVPKETQQVVGGGVQKFRVKLMSVDPRETSLDILCQIDLNGISFIAPSNNETLKVFALDSVTSWEATEDIFTFWTKRSSDSEQRCTRLQSNKYTANTILGAVAAACIQFTEIADEQTGSNEVRRTSDLITESELSDFPNMIKAIYGEKDHWVPDEAVPKCTFCSVNFGTFVRKHHCRNCGNIFCHKCSRGRINIPYIYINRDDTQQARVCEKCKKELSLRLKIEVDSDSKSVNTLTHENLAKKLQEEMKRKLNLSSGSTTDSTSSEDQMIDVACPHCTADLEVELPTSTRETVECGVCQHYFIIGKQW